MNEYMNLPNQYGNFAQNNQRQVAYNPMQNPYPSSYSYANQNPNFGYGQQQQQLAPQQSQQSQQSQQAQTAFAYVNGIEGAKAWIVQPNSTILLMDMDDDKFYFKSADQTGRASLKGYDFLEFEIDGKKKAKANTAETQPTVEYVAKPEFDTLRNDFYLLVQKLTTTQTTPIQADLAQSTVAKEASKILLSEGNLNG